MLKKILSSTIIKLVLAVIAGILLGFVVGEGFMNVVVTLKYILGQLIFFMVPLIILAFISSSIAKMKGNASRMLGWALGLAYLSSVGAAFMAMFLGYWLIPLLTISPATEGLKEIPELVFKLDIPPVMSVMTALVVAIMVGLATVWTKSQIFETILDNFQKMVLLLINRILIPILPFFIAANFCALSYEGSITRQLPVFLNVMGIVLTAHFIWLFFLYLSAGVFSGKILAGGTVLWSGLSDSSGNDVIGRYFTGCCLNLPKKVLYSKEKWSILPFLCLLTFIYVVLY